VLLPSETTAVLCCPSGYKQGPWANACASTIEEDTFVTYFEPFLSDNVYYPGSVTVSKFNKGESVLGDGVPIWYQASDSKVLAAATQTTSQTSFLATPQSNGTTRPTSSGLSTGAKVGLGVAIPLAIILGLVSGWLLSRQRKAKTHAPLPEEMQDYGAYAPENAPLNTYYAHTDELEQPLQELPNQLGLAHELPAGGDRVQTASTHGLR
jgi:hypothetical protein